MTDPTTGVAQAGALRATIDDDSAPESNAPGFYRIDARHITLKECWWGTRTPLALVAWLILKATGDRVPCSTDDPAVESLEPFEVDETALPPAIRDRFQDGAKQLAALGFHSPSWHAIADRRQKTETYLATFAHRSLPVVARLHSRLWAIKTPPRETHFVELITAFADGTFLWSLSGKADMLAPRTCRIVRRRDASPADLLKLHEQALGSDPAIRRRMPASARDQALDVAERLHEAVRDFHVKRGVFAPFSRADHDQAAADQQVRHQAVATGSGYPEVLVEIDRIQRHKTGWAGAIVLLVLSFVLFLAIGVKGQSLLGVLALVPILLFHEAGHYVSMKVFGYRNLRMFLIPGFGAAVTGRHFNVPGWKQAIVSLMGPIPGVVLGVFIGVAGVIWDVKLAVQAAFLTLILNGFNLLPLLPLDGGRVVHTVLFARVLALDILFRVLAVVGLIAVGVALDTRVFMILAVIMAIGLPHAVRIARAARELRAAGVTGGSADDQTIPPAVADQIITRLTAGRARPPHVGMLAQQTLQVFETLNTRPPGWLASIGLLTLQTVGLAFAVVFGALFAVAQQGSLEEFFRSAANRPQHALVVSDIRASPGPPPTGTPASNSTVIATFGTAEAAAAAYTEALGQLADGERALLFGESVFIGFAAADDEARKRWLGRFQPRTEDVFVESASLRALFRFHILARTASDADALEAELDRYMSLPLAEGLVAPWSPDAAVTGEERLARETFARLRRAQRDLWEDPGLVRLREDMWKAQKTGAREEHAALLTRMAERTTALRRERLQAIADDPAADQALASLYLERTMSGQASDEEDEFDDPLGRELAPRFGLVPAPGASGASDLTYATSGWCTRAGLVVDVHYISFADAGSGAMAFSDWLASRGVSRVRYEVMGQPEYDEEADEDAAGEADSAPSGGG